MKKLFIIVAVLGTITLICAIICGAVRKDGSVSQPAGSIDRLADIDVNREIISNEELDAIVKTCTANSGCAIWDSADDRRICICAEPEKYQANNTLLFFIYRSLDSENEWELAGHGNLSADPAKSAYWLNSSLKPCFGEDNQLNSTFVLETFERMGKTYHW